MPLTVNEAAALLGIDDLTVGDIVAGGELSLHADGIPETEQKRLIGLLDAPRPRESAGAVAETITATLRGELLQSGQAPEAELTAGDVGPGARLG